MAKLNEIIAVEKAVKAKSHSDISELYKILQKEALFNGFSKDYKKLDEEGEEFPPERQLVQQTVSDMIRAVEKAMYRLFDVTARKDWTNCAATADVKIDGRTLIPDAPVTFLLFLEKQLTDLRTFIATLPVLADTERWSKDENSGLFKSEVVRRHKTKKTQRPIVLYDATPEHPAQTQLISEDVLVGHWHEEKNSGAMPKTEKTLMLERADKLLYAVKQAREQANMEEVVPTPDVASAIFTYLTGAS